LLYDVKTGRLVFEADDVMTSYKAPKRRSMIAVCETKIKRPAFDTVLDDSIEKKLSSYKIKFLPQSDKTFIKRIIGFSEAFKMVRRFSLHVAATLIVAVIFYGSVAAVDLRLAREAFIDGKAVGLVTNTDKFEALMEELKASVSSTVGTEISSDDKPVYILRLVFGKDITDEFQLRQNILSTFDEVAEAYAIYQNERLVCGALDEETAYEMIEKVKSMYAEDGADQKVEFVDDIIVRKEYIPVGFIRTAEGVFDALTATKEAPKVYTVADNDTLWGIANKFGMSVDELFALNDNLSETIHAGQEIHITKSEPLISVKTSYVYEGEKPIPYEVDEVADDSMYVGNKKVIKEGVEGKKYVVEEVVKINGEPVETKVIKEEVISQPVAATVSVGTRKTLATGSFSRPVYGTISSRYGRRGGRMHQGLDIAASTGTPIRAADGGTVTYAGWQGGYGYLVIVNHGNGYQTYYGHCSAIHVKVGQKVDKGDHIANVGNTGRSSGPHLHFEVRANGVPQNPANYVSY
jgi:murein DD-endopeptidase MepM/ murein hydrolase activator NlpD